MLPDDALLKIFDFYVGDVKEGVNNRVMVFSEEQRIKGWITLAHVCWRWRSVVFQSPRRLNLRLVCTHKTPARDTLNIWPPFPLVICDSSNSFDDKLLDELPSTSSGLDNIIAALEHNDLVCQIDLNLTSSPMGYVTDSAAMQKPFPELTHLWLTSYEGPTLPDSFLRGTAPRLRLLVLNDVPFPGLPKLLLSAAHLAELNLHEIPRSGYIPPEVMATSLTALTSLESLCLTFKSPRLRPALERRRPPPPPLTRSVLPSLTEILFKGASEYLEVILAWIDAPRLDILHIRFFKPNIFDTPQLFQSISRSPTLMALKEGHIEFNSGAITVYFVPQPSNYRVPLSVEILCKASEWQLSSLEQVCTSSLPPVSMLEDLHISEDLRQPLHWQDDVADTLWLDLLRPFVAVKNLYLSEESVLLIAPAMQELVGGRTAEVLPALENIFLWPLQMSGPLEEGIEKFVAARQLTNRPVSVYRWDKTRSRKD